MKTPRRIAWSAETIDLSDPIQRWWTIRQVLLHCRSEDVRTLDLSEVAALLENLNLPEPVYRLWQALLEWKGYMFTPQIVRKGGSGHGSV